MNHNRLHAKNWLLVGFASWFLGGVGMAGAPPANRIVGDRQPTASQSPVIVENPYATRQPAAAQASMLSTPERNQSTVFPDVDDHAVFGDVPIVRRLPEVGPLDVVADSAAMPRQSLAASDTTDVEWDVDMAAPGTQAVPVDNAVQETGDDPQSFPSTTSDMVSGNDVTPVSPSEPWTPNQQATAAELARQDAAIPERGCVADRDVVLGVPVDEQVAPPSSAMAGTTETTSPMEPPTATTPYYTPTSVGLSAQLLPAVQHGYALAQRGAVSAARIEFIRVLRRVAQAKDAERNTDEYSRALADGLRALDEAQDFVPAGVQLEAELDVRIVASSHRTPVLRERGLRIQPREAVILYHDYAQEKLVRAMDGDQAGSMVLHGLGKVYSRLAERDDDLHAMHSAITMYLAALTTCPTNHLAANELGVLLCRQGRAAQAAILFERTIDLSPSATAYRNLAMTQQKLGMDGQAAANEQESQRLAAIDRAHGVLSRRVGVQWVSPEEMSGVTQVAPLAPAAYNSAASTSNQQSPVVGVPTPERSRWQRTKDFAKSLPLIR